MFRRALLIGAVLATWTAQANACAGPCGSGCGDGCGSAPAMASAGCAPAPAFRTVTVTEWVPEQYQTTRTTYRTEHVTESYTAYRTECVPETRTCMVTVTKMVPECRDEVRTTYTCVPTCETRTVSKKVWTCKPVTTVSRKCVDQGHYECKEVPCGPSLRDRLGHKKGCCADPCDPCATTCCEPVRTKTVKVWVPNKVWIETPCTKMVRTCETVCSTETVTVMKKVPQTHVVKVTVNRCVTEQVPQTTTVMVSRCVPYQATRTVAKCVPVTEPVTACRMVCRTSQKVVPVETCSDACAPACDQCGGSSKGHGMRLFKSCCH